MLGQHALVDAVTAAVTLAHRLGLPIGEPVPLRSTNNTVVWLRPNLVVAKVFHAESAATQELVVAHELAHRGAPIVAPAEAFGGELHQVGGWFVTLWRYVPQDDASPARSEEVAVALHELHRALLSLAGSMTLRSYDSQVRDAIRALEEPSFAPALAGSDRALLQETLGGSLADLQHTSEVVVHGSPHAMNIVMDDGVPRFIDLETIRRGPIEWDLAHLDPEVAVHYPAPYDDEILARCRVAVSATTATWCWHGLHKGPDMRTHAQHHLEQVRLARQ